MPRRNHKHKPSKHTPFSLGGAQASAVCQSKQAYASEFAAQQAIARTRQYNPDVELTVYFCPNCQHYHLTRKKSTN